jgi:hypothetical protein
VILTFEVVEKCALTHISSFGNIFHRDIGIAAFGKELKRASEESHPRFYSTALASVRAWRLRQTIGGLSFDERGWTFYMTFAHIRSLGIYDHWSFIALR